MRNTRKRFAAGLGALAVTLGSFGLGAAASADQVGQVGPDQEGHPTSGSLTIHKLVGSQGSAGDGTQQNISGKALADVDFTIWQLGKDSGGTCKAIDLTDTNAWANVPATTAPATLDAVKAAGYCVVDPAAGTTKTTDANGELTFSGLALGVYYVDETKAPANVSSKSAPFYVSVPLPHTDGSWIYNVHAYPKNQVVDAPSKTINTDVNQGGLTVGSTVQYTITQTVPALNAGETYKSASIWDVMPTDGSLAYNSTASVKLNGTALDAADYTIDPSGTTWKLSDSGLKKLHAGDTLEVVFTAKVLKVTATGDIQNPGSDGTKPGYGSEFNGGKVPGGPTPYTYWGQLKVTKVDQKDKALAGAEFAVTAKGTEACAAEVGNQTVVSAGTSGSDGVVLWSPNTPDKSSPLGLFVANSSNGALTNPSKDYCLYETKAPAGYTGAAVKSVNVKAGTTAMLNVSVTNTQKEGPKLPLTGAQGTLLMVVGGLVLVAAGTGAVVATRKRQSTQD